MTDSTNQSEADKIDVAYVANLARMDLSEEERKTFQVQLTEIVGFVRKINELDLSGIEPTSHGHPVVNVFRQDAVQPGLEKGPVLDNAPAQKDGQFSVPKILE